MRGFFAFLTVLSVSSIACVTSPLSKRGSKNVPCNPDGTCAPGLVCVSNLCVPADSGALTGTGGGAGGQSMYGSTGGGWAGATGGAGAATGGSSVLASTELNTGGRGSDTAGSRASGGSAGTLVMGGITLTAGQFANAGATVVGGDRGAGGMTIAGGSHSTGGITTGGTRATAGTTVLVTGGTTTSSSPPWSGSRPSNYVFFSDGMAVGLICGRGWVALGQQDTVTSPTCGASGTPITSATPCTTKTNWGPMNLCIEGHIPALPASPTQADFDNNWGVRIGVNAAEPNDSVGPGISFFNSVAFRFSASPLAGWRAFVHRKGDPDAVTYCFDGVKADHAVAFSQFNTKCWGDDSGVYLTPADLPNIDQIGLGISSTSSAITIENSCLYGLAFYE